MGKRKKQVERKQNGNTNWWFQMCTKDSKQSNLHVTKLFNFTVHSKLAVFRIQSDRTTRATCNDVFFSLFSCTNVKYVRLNNQVFVCN